MIGIDNIMGDLSKIIETLPAEDRAIFNVFNQKVDKIKNDPTISGHEKIELLKKLGSEYGADNII